VYVNAAIYTKKRMKVEKYVECRPNPRYNFCWRKLWRKN